MAVGLAVEGDGASVTVASASSATYVRLLDMMTGLAGRGCLQDVARCPKW